jgi:hypothetical protein
MLITKAKRIGRHKLILNSHNKAKTTWDIINKVSGRTKKGSEVQTVKVKGKKSLINKKLLKFLLNIVTIAKNVKRQSKNEHSNDDNNNTDSHTFFME